MNVYIFSDESGVFDFLHNDFFVFSGVICFGSNERDDVSRKFSHVESVLRETKHFKRNVELKASRISNKDKGKFFRSLNNTYKFCVLIKQKELHKEIFENKKHKQRYLDYAYKLVLKKCFKTLIERKCLNPEEVQNIVVKVDEHITATDGIYELRENLLNEFKNGTFNFTWDLFYKPIFPKLENVEVYFCDSKTTTLIRAADIIANHCWHSAVKNNGDIEKERNMFTLLLPSNVILCDGIEYFSDPVFNSNL